MDRLENLELKISKFLRLGVLCSGFFLGIGWLGNFSFENSHPSRFATYSPVDLMTSLELAVMGGNWALLLSYIGLIILIGLPMIRVLLTAVLFVKQKEHILAAIAGVVLLALIISFSFGIEL
ncbi:MAG: DUF1634 domain-containing protein [Bacteriovoracaceae bacterium]|jgi:uncharacterized membrane protein